MLTYERASELLQYDPETGRLFWRVNRKRVKAGDEAGALKRAPRNTYRLIGADGRLYLAHRIAWLLHYGTWPASDIDHLDGDGLNNTPGNMRDVSRQVNLRNQRMYRRNTSGHVGVCWNKQTGKWMAYIRINGKQKYLGLFDNIDKAAAAYRKKADANGFTERHGVAV